MRKRDVLQFFAEFWKISPSQVNDALRLDDEQLHDYSSLRFYQFIAALESNFNVKVDNIAALSSFKDLCDNIIH